MSNSSSLTVYIANDHAGYDLKVAIVKELQSRGIRCIDLGADSPESVDYPLFAKDLALKMEHDHDNAFGILVCGTGTGMAIAANRFPWMRAAVFDGRLEILKLAREKNHINTLCFGAKYFDMSQLSECLTTFLKISPPQNDRHLRRVNQLGEMGS